MLFLNLNKALCSKRYFIFNFLINLDKIHKKCITTFIDLTLKSSVLCFGIFIFLSLSSNLKRFINLWITCIFFPVKIYLIPLLVNRYKYKKSKKTLTKSLFMIFGKCIFVKKKKPLKMDSSTCVIIKLLTINSLPSSINKNGLFAKLILPEISCNIFLFNISISSY